MAYGEQAQAGDGLLRAGAVESVRPRVPPASAYVRSQLSAVAASLVDFVWTVLCVEAAGLHYLVATALGALAGGLTAFIANRHWSFRAAHHRVGGQMLRYMLVWLGSISLNCALVYAMTDGVGWSYMPSKALTAMLVGTCFNFPLHRYVVFR